MPFARKYAHAGRVSLPPDADDAAAAGPPTNLPIRFASATTFTVCIGAQNSAGDGRIKRAMAWICAVELPSSNRTARSPFQNHGIGGGTSFLQTDTPFAELVAIGTTRPPPPGITSC